MASVLSRKQIVDRVTKADSKLLKLVNELINDYEDTDDNQSVLTKEQKKEVDRRLQLHKEGKLKYYTLSEIKKSILSKSKK